MWFAMACRVCLHPNPDIKHWVDYCKSFGCTQQIRVCLSEHEVKDIEGTVHKHYSGPMVCRECPYHGRNGIKGDYRTYPLVARVYSQITVIEEGIEADETATN